MARMVRAVITLWISILRSCGAVFRTRREQAIVELALRQQLAIYARRHRRPRLLPLDRVFWVALSHLWPRWKSVLVVVQPETVVRWHQRRFRTYWRSISTPGPGRPPISDETKALIVRMATENRWRARKIQAELSKLGIRVSLATISRTSTTTTRRESTPRSAMRPPAGRSSIGLQPTPWWLLCRALAASTIDTAGEMRLDQSRGDRWSDTRSVPMNIDNAQAG